MNTFGKVIAAFDHAGIDVRAAYWDWDGRDDDYEGCTGHAHLPFVLVTPDGVESTVTGVVLDGDRIVVVHA